MNLQSLVAVILRLMALDLLMCSVEWLLPRLFAMTEPAATPLPAFRQLMPFIVIGVVAIVAVLVWVLAPSIGRLIIRGLPQNFSFGALSLADCYSVAFIGMGVFYIAGNLPPALNWAYYLLRLAASSAGTSLAEQVGGRGYDISHVFIAFVIGIVLLVNGRKWAVALAQKHIAPEHPVEPTPQTE